MSTIDGIGNIASNREKYKDMFTDDSNDSVSMETFYKLLMAEMQNQDPMEPMSNTEFISQMASFTSLQTQQDALYFNNANYAQSLVGKTVTVSSVRDSEAYSESGVVTSMKMSNDKFYVKVNGTDYTLDNIIEVLPSTNPFAASSNDGSFATSLIGKNVTVSAINELGENVVEEGEVSHIEIKENNISIIINNIAYPLSSVVKVENMAEAAAASSTSTSTSDEEDDEDYYDASAGSTDIPNVGTYKKASGTTNTENSAETSVLEETENNSKNNSETTVISEFPSDSIIEEDTDYIGGPYNLNEKDELDALFN